jgi:hypothetical protein
MYQRHFLVSFLQLRHFCVHSLEVWDSLKIRFKQRQNHFLTISVFCITGLQQWCIWPFKTLMLRLPTTLNGTSQWGFIFGTFRSTTWPSLRETLTIMMKPVISSN